MPFKMFVVCSIEPLGIYYKYLHSTLRSRRQKDKYLRSPDRGATSQSMEGESFYKDQYTHNMETLKFTIHQRKDIPHNVPQEKWATFKIRKTSFMDHGRNIYAFLTFIF